MPIMGSKMPIMGISETRASSRKPSSRRKVTQRAPRALPRASLADALFSTTRQRVLGLLYGQPDRSFFATELIGLARSGFGAVQRELARLVASGLVSVVPVGKQRHYRANVETPIFDELRGIVVKTVGLESPVRNALETLGPRTQLALIYGSVAKKEDRAGSDIDLLVVSDHLTLEQLYAALAPVEVRLARPVRPTLYTSKEFRDRRRTDSSFLRRVLGGPYRILIGTVTAQGAMASA
jgi:predicted nucleotidyltransferase